MHPTKANYQKAFGTKNDIGYRVDKYNQSQQQGAGYVKTAVKVGVGIATVATAIRFRRYITCCGEEAQWQGQAALLQRLILP